MDITTIVITWLLVLTIAVVCLSAICVYLYRTGENTRLDAMALRARLNKLPDTTTVRSAKRNHTIPPSKKVVNSLKGVSSRLIRQKKHLLNHKRLHIESLLLSQKLRRMPYISAINDGVLRHRRIKPVMGTASDHS
jgi:hypothetical protein